MNKTVYDEEEALKYSKISLKGEGTLYLSFRDIESILNEHFPTFRSSCKVIDYGCGTGRSSRYLKSLGISDVDGFDVSEDMIQQAHHLDPIGKYEKITSAEIPANDSTYDLAFLSFVTLVIDNKKEITKIFKELHRVLKRGGQVLSLTLSEIFWNPELKWVSYKQDYPENYFPESGQKSRLKIKFIDLELTDYYWTEKDIISCAEEAGLFLNKLYYPHGNESDGIEWLDEKYASPYTLFSFSKR